LLVGYETFTKTLCELEDGTPLSPKHLLPLLTETDTDPATCRNLIDARLHALRAPPDG
jgi:hypothetical protein